ncbi:hypothetical protein [Micromonospora sp. NPDC005652]|uniref:hypothetical protein n=1 Tax=Micromonospora sp. NPDC005652 TaxID=3157046 RepID=UPI0033F8BF64
MEHVYSTSDPDIVAAYREALEAYNAMSRKCREDAATLGKNKGALVVRAGLLSPEVVGLKADDPNDPPAGRIYLKKWERLVPRRGKAGEAAERWLKEHQPPSVLAALEEHGLPSICQPGEDYRFFLTPPGVFEHDGTLWAKYPNEPSGECTWTQRRLSQWHAAREAAEDAEKQQAG